MPASPAVACLVQAKVWTVAVVLDALVEQGPAGRAGHGAVEPVDGAEQHELVTRQDRRGHGHAGDGGVDVGGRSGAERHGGCLVRVDHRHTGGLGVGDVVVVGHGQRDRVAARLVVAVLGGRAGGRRAVAEGPLEGLECAVGVRGAGAVEGAGEPGAGRREVRGRREVGHLDLHLPGRGGGGAAVVGHGQRHGVGAAHGVDVVRGDAGAGGGAVAEVPGVGRDGPVGVGARRGIERAGGAAAGLRERCRRRRVRDLEAGRGVVEGVAGPPVLTVDVGAADGHVGARHGQPGGRVPGPAHEVAVGARGVELVVHHEHALHVVPADAAGVAGAAEALGADDPALGGEASPVQLVRARLGEVDPAGRRVVEHARDVRQVLGREPVQGGAHAVDQLERDRRLRAEGRAVVGLHLEGGVGPAGVELAVDHEGSPHVTPGRGARCRDGAPGDRAAGEGPRLRPVEVRTRPTLEQAERDDLRGQRADVVGRQLRPAGERQEGDAASVLEVGDAVGVRADPQSFVGGQEPVDAVRAGAAGVPAQHDAATGIVGRERLAGHGAGGDGVADVGVVHVAVVATCVHGGVGDGDLGDRVAAGVLRPGGLQPGPGGAELPPGDRVAQVRRGRRRVGAGGHHREVGAVG